MRIALIVPVVTTLLSVLGPPRALANGGDERLCHNATRQAEHVNGVPDQLLTAISRVESGRADPETGRQEAWPWSINVEGTGHAYASRDEAINAVRAFEARGARSIDVGCMQINLRQHPGAFYSLEDAFDPDSNAAFAARFLVQLFRQTGSWPHAAAAYHSETPELGSDYQSEVLAKWAEGDGPAQAKSDRPLQKVDLANSIGQRAMQMPAIFAAQPTGASPFGLVRPASVVRYGPQASALPPGSGRSLAAYRLIPIARSGGHRL